MRADSQTWDVLVVGAGPAGSLTALGLARRGLAVLLVDRASFPRWKVCGCCLTGAAQSLLTGAGLGGLVRCNAVPLRALCLAAGTRHAELPLPGWVTLSRETLDTALVDAARSAGATVLADTLARPAGVTANGRLVRLQSGGTERTLTARVVVAADGLGGTFLDGVTGFVRRVSAAARVGAGAVADAAPAFYQAGTVYMTCGEGGYLGLTRLEDGRLDLAAAFDRAAVRSAGGPGPLAARLVREAGWPAVPYAAGLRWRGTPPLTRSAPRLGGERLLVVGDAAGYVEPFTGEGITWALASAAAVVPFVLRGVRDWPPALAGAWSRRHRQGLALRRLPCRLLAGVLRRPGLTAALVSLLARLPALGVPVIRALGAGAAGAANP